MARPKSTAPVIAAAEVTIDPGNIGANSSLEVTATVNGALPGYPVNVWCPTLEANVLLGGAYCSAVNTVKFRLTNPTGSGIDPASQKFYFIQR